MCEKIFENIELYHGEQIEDKISSLIVRIYLDCQKSKILDNNSFENMSSEQLKEKIMSCVGWFVSENDLNIFFDKVCDNSDVFSLLLSAATKASLIKVEKNEFILLFLQETQKKVEKAIKDSEKL